MTWIVSLISSAVKMAKTAISFNVFSYVRPMLLHRMALFSFRLFRKNLGKLREFFWANGLPPPPSGKKLPVRL